MNLILLVPINSRNWDEPQTKGVLNHDKITIISWRPIRRHPPVRHSHALHVPGFNRRVVPGVLVTGIGRGTAALWGIRPLFSMGGHSGHAWAFTGWIYCMVMHNIQLVPVDYHFMQSTTFSENTTLRLNYFDKPKSMETHNGYQLVRDSLFFMNETHPPSR